MIIQRPVAILCSALLYGCGGGGGESSSKTAMCLPVTLLPSSSVTLEAVVDGVVSDQIKTLGLPGVSVALGKRGTVLIAKGYGYSDLTTCQPARAETEFQIGSVTKQFTAAAILKLGSSGALDIDDPVITHLPAYGFDPRITLRTLLNHTSGLPDYVSFSAASSWTAGVSEQTVLTQISTAPLMFTPGSAYSYSNSNYYVLGAVIEAVSSMSYQDYLA